MAPNFFSKLVKPGDRRSGDISRDRSPARPHSKSLSAADSDSSSFHSPGLLDGDQSRYSDDGHPNVNIVPPSPAGHAFAFPSDDHLPDGQGHQRFKTDSGLGLGNGPSPPRRSDGGVERRAVSLNVGVGQSPLLQQQLDDALPTPTPESMKAASSSNNLRGSADDSQFSTPNSPESSPDSNGNLPRTPSKSSMRSHPRSMTDSALGLDLKDIQASNASTFSRDESVMQTIVESPTAFRTEFIPHGTINVPMSASASAGSNFLSPHRRADTDAASIRSTSTSGKKRRPWKRGSNPSSPKSPPSNLPSLPSQISVTSSGSSKRDRKQTGLAGALAATGMALANPGTPMFPGNSNSLNAYGRTNGGSGFTLMKSASSTSLAKQSEPGSASRTRGASTSSHVSSRPNGARGKKTRSRNTSLGSGETGSDLFDSESDEEGLSGDEEDSDELDLNDEDIPVTGFAVASNKRNADFHEMFQGIPEGDYLIDDYGCALQREILIQGRLYISENHVCFHANIFGWITDLCIPMYDITSLEKKMTAFVIPNAIQINTRTAKYTFASFLSRDTTFDVIYNIWRLARPEDSSMGRPSLDDAVGVNGDVLVEGAAEGGVKKKGRKVTQCACLKAGDHFTETAMDTILPGTPEKIYNLMFASGFVKEFMVQDQKLMDIQISDWTPSPDNPQALFRNMSYIKPLSGGLGPKQTKCELRDETLHCDFDDYVVMLTTTRTPDVPSGNVFSVKTKTCLMWASNVSTRIVVTSQVEWTGRSFIKGIIEKSCIEGQKTYHSELDAAIRKYISEHQSEFIPQGMDAEAAIAEGEEDSESPSSPGGGPGSVATDTSKKRPEPGNQRGLQWAYDTFEGAYKVGKQSAVGAIELLQDAWSQSSTTTVLYFVIVFLVLSNIYSLTIVGKREEVGRRREMRRTTEEREKWVQGVVSALAEELAGRSAATDAPPIIRPSEDWRGEVSEINKVLDALDIRVQGLRESLRDLD
ncbi:hypothetical protein OE88DRAFT_1650390 [Heliocybe sulcata]|uniref:VASt domain-containing protein n=1 Tax=Heliocybe sulcata TaxID=5364 RepID=A0A5C3NGN4_9AGAM|nr:hypothetical protein OE88DRAFT_1650390 [Heliocybe sulcata]